ncbi:MAG: hypothetical protein J0I21_16675 [Alphaproteobacteria bacterium]|nr:hypothetical protein [Alphaproteobacteria bacterium]
MRHPGDPAAPWRAAPVLGRLVACGRLRMAEAQAALAAVPAPGADPSGWQARSTWRLADAVAEQRRARAGAADAIVRALRPMLAARAPRAALFRAAMEADRRRALTRREVARMVRELVAAELAGRR